VSDRTKLGTADVDDARLLAMVAALHGEEAPGALLDVQVDEVDYDLEAITTAGRHRVHGNAQYNGHVLAFSIFVKQIQSWERSPLFAEVPEVIREFAAASVPWRTEALVYRSDLSRHLPDGLSMPRALGVFDLDDKSAAIWLEEVPAIEVTWDLPRFERAAHLLGRLAGSAAVAPYAQVGEFDWSVTTYVEGRVRHQVIPMLHADPLWQHPLIAGAFDDGLRARMIAASDRVSAYADELLGLPAAVGHGDACPGNLLVRVDDPDSFTLIDFGFWLTLPIGYDLGQLLVGDVQIGRRSSSDLAERDEICLSAYLDGLRAEGIQIRAADLRRAHALQLLIFTGLSSLPFEHLDSQPTAELAALAADRAALSRYCLDLVEATS
jgi:hypothetical protein